MRESCVPWQSTPSLANRTSNPEETRVIRMGNTTPPRCQLLPPWVIGNDGKWATPLECWFPDARILSTETQCHIYSISILYPGRHHPPLQRIASYLGFQLYLQQNIPLLCQASGFWMGQYVIGPTSFIVKWGPGHMLWSVGSHVSGIGTLRSLDSGVAEAL